MSKHGKKKNKKEGVWPFKVEVSSTRADFRSLFGETNKRIRYLRATPITGGKLLHFILMGKEPGNGEKERFKSQVLAHAKAGKSSIGRDSQHSDSTRATGAGYNRGW